jgi:hypothetical protein
MYKTAAEIFLSNFENTKFYRAATEIHAGVFLTQYFVPPPPDKCNNYF